MGDSPWSPTWRGTSYLLLGNLHRVPENRPEHRGVARRGGQGPFVVVVLSGSLGKQLFNAETWNEHFLAWRDMLGGAVSVLLPVADVQLNIGLSLETLSGPSDPRAWSQRATAPCIHLSPGHIGLTTSFSRKV